jgi:16S rRNA A1518/A1519 N6-dimethyltransferase RsmA/KsgA/DIM1 with predicted DNA glycosylase/AP lyase activity
MDRLDPDLYSSKVAHIQDKRMRTSDFANFESFSANCFISERWFLKSSLDGLTSNLLKTENMSQALS